MRMRAPRGHPRVGARTGLLFPSGVLVGCCVRVTIRNSQTLELPSLLWVRVSAAAQHAGRLSLHVTQLSGRPVGTTAGGGSPDDPSDCSWPGCPLAVCPCSWRLALRLVGNTGERGGRPAKAGPPGLCAAVQSFSRGLAWAPGAAHICTA